MNFRSVQDLNETIVRKLAAIPSDVDLVVGIPRSGLLAANIVALHLNLPLTDVDGLLEGRILRAGPRLRRRAHGLTEADWTHALIIDDSVLGGATMRETRHRVEQAGLAGRVTYGCVYVSREGRGCVDIALEEIIGARVFEWNLMHGGVIERSCVDIDGVLCVDPTERENDDGPRYLTFLETARPLRLPTVPVARLVTCRLEKYRAPTEQWLRRHGVRYGALHMMDLPTKEARLASGSHASFKASIYRASDTLLFVESSRRQAEEIARRARRPVLCMETLRMVYPSLAAHAPRLARQTPTLARGWVRRIRRSLRRHVLGHDPAPGSSA